MRGGVDPVGLGEHIGAGRRVGQRKTEAAPRAGLRAPQRRPGVVDREDHDPCGAERVDRAAVLARDGLDAGQEFLVLALRVVDQHRLRLDERGQLRSLAGVVHAELDDAGAVPAAVVLAQAQQGQRHADVVVEVARGGEAALAVPGAQDRADHLRDRGLAIAAGDGQQRQVQVAPPGRGELLQRGQRVDDLQARQPGLGQPARGQRGDRAGGARGGQEVVTVVALAGQRDEQVARAQRAAVAVHAVERGRTVADQGGCRQQRLRLRQGHHRGGAHAAAPARAASARAASARSLKGRRTPAASCVSS